LYDLNSLSLLPKTDPVGLLVLGRPVNVVNHAWVDGKAIVADGQVKTVDVAALKRQFFELSEWQSNRQSPTRAAAEGHYRNIMGLL
ncbi:MAG TPA: amidohydrolase, partial [Chroococcidiopsis sp.]